MKIIDAHHHLWDLSNRWNPEYSGNAEQRIWGSTDQLRHDYLLSDFLTDTKNQNVVKSVHVQACANSADPAAETRWLQTIADEPDSGGFPHAIVGWADFTVDHVEAMLEAQLEFSNFRGVRQIAARSCDPLLNQAQCDFLNDDTWISNFAHLARYRLSFDLQIAVPQLGDAARLAAQNPDISIVLLHLALPIERHRAGMDIWRNGMRKLAECPNAFVKITGFGLTDFF